MAKQNNKCGASNKDGSRKPYTRDRGGKPKYGRGTDGTSKLTDAKSNINQAHPNDPSWYMVDPTIKRQITQGFNFDRATGTKLGYNFITGSDTYSYPGIMRISYNPLYGFAANREDPLNAVANNLYTYINARNSRNTTYDPNDLMLYFICVDSAFQHLGLMRRIYGTMNYANTYNKYYPKGIVEAVGGNFEDIQKNIANLQGYINWFTQQVQACVLPSNMPIFRHHQFLVNNIFCDTDGVKSQVYTFTPEGYYTFSLDEDSAGQAVYNMYYDSTDTTVQVTNGYKYTLTYDRLVKIGNSILQQIRFLYGQADFNMISADIIKALGMENVYSYDLTPIGYTVLPSDDEWIHQQIQNSTIWGALDPSTLYIKQSSDKGYLVSTPQKVISTSGAYTLIESEVYGADRPLNSYNDVPSEDELLEITRMMCIPEVTAGINNVTLKFKNFADVICTRCCIYYFLADGNDAWNLAVTEEINGYTKSYLQTESSDTIEQINAKIEAYMNNDAYVKLVMTMMSSFRYHPYIYYETKSIIGGVRKGGYISPYALGDTQNVAKARPDVLESMNTNILNHMMGLSTWTLKS